MSDTLEKTITKNLAAYQSAPRWIIAYSGGLDSTVLLHAITELKKTSTNSLPHISAVHINHQLNPHADAWAQHCQSICDALAIPLTIVRVAVENIGDGLEAAARAARYQAFANNLSAGEILLQAHHADDQAETVLLRLMRGTGMTGLAAIPPQRDLMLSNSLSTTATIVRPLLAMTRPQLHAYAVAKKISWIEDNSNNDTKFDRNYLRHEILPRLTQRWPAAINTLARSTSQIADDNQLLRELGDSDWQSCAATAANGEQALTVNGLLDLSPARRNNAIRSWLMQRELPLPDAAMSQRLSAELLLARIDAEPCLQWSNVEAHRYANRLFVFSRLPVFDQAAEYSWDTAVPLAIDGVGILQMSAKHDEILQVKFRRGGERCQPEGRAHSQTVKKLMQEYRVPPWLRDRVPLIYRGEELIAVVGYWMCEGSQLPDIDVDWYLV